MTSIAPVGVPVAGRFELLSPLAGHGAGDVWSARDLHDGHDVIVTFLGRALRTDDARFEALAARLSPSGGRAVPSVCLVAVHDGWRCVVTERSLVAALRALDDWTDGHRHAGARLRCELMLALLERLCDAHEGPRGASCANTLHAPLPLGNPAPREAEESAHDDEERTAVDVRATVARARRYTVIGLPSVPNGARRIEEAMRDEVLEDTSFVALPARLRRPNRVSTVAVERVGLTRQSSLAQSEPPTSEPTREMPIGQLAAAIARRGAVLDAPPRASSPAEFLASATRNSPSSRPSWVEAARPGFDEGRVVAAVAFTVSLLAAVAAIAVRG